MDAMVVSAIESAQAAERYGLAHDQIILSAKVSGVQDLIDVYRKLAARVRLPAAPGPHRSRAWARRASWPPPPRLSVLLQEGIGDTIRASLTPLPNGDRTEEVIVCQQILQSLGIRSFTPQVTACPGCGRTTSTFFQDMADQIQTYLREQMPVWKETLHRRRRDEGGGDGLRRQRARANRSTPTSASRCPARSRSRRRRSTWTANSSPRSRATPSSPSSSPCSTTTSSAATPPRLG